MIVLKEGPVNPVFNICLDQREVEKLTLILFEFNQLFKGPYEPENKFAKQLLDKIYKAEQKKAR